LPTPPTELLGERAVRALRGLGFGEKEARRAAEHAMRDFPTEAELEGMIRRCLARLTDRQLSRLA
jgi:Holliday junction resolvasome RuvABC DNA-binding subunit